ncbi:hypothetical protein LOK49_LG08G00261 [Camellia lanceoleosa]|uniref:Uncharacterized protein n=1 Tax=Camellia lanceoleosa TaxID=1840588 RepID=A0ACC0GXW8_9ERIC|nr:hypothetical protein LOK49_LG08G00261 [Camellia lanceoleosa]
MAKNLGSFIENTNTSIVEIGHRVGYSHDLSQQRRLVNAELLKLPMSNTQRLMAASMIVKDEDKVDLFFSLDENDKMEWVSLLLEDLPPHHYTPPPRISLNSPSKKKNLGFSSLHFFFFSYVYEMAQIWPLISVRTLTILQLFIPGVFASTTFTFVNKCDYTVWPGILSNAGIAPLSTTGFSLQTGESKTINPPSSWGGQLWGRTRCTEDSTGKFTCVTGDCGSGKLECSGGHPAPPATLAEFTLDGSGGLDVYGVSLVDGHNLPMLVVPQDGTGVNCTTTGCEVDLNGACPSELKVTSSEGECLACKSPCKAFGQAQYCCSGAYGTPDTCKPSSYSELFKSACPTAYSYAYDDKTSTFTCVGAAAYLITFCASLNTSQKSSSGQNPVASLNTPEINGTMVYEGASDTSSASSLYPWSHMFCFQSIAGVGTMMAAVWPF